MVNVLGRRFMHTNHVISENFGSFLYIGVIKVYTYKVEISLNLFDHEAKYWTTFKFNIGIASLDVAIHIVVEALYIP